MPRAGGPTAVAAPAAAKQPQRWEYKISKRGGHQQQPEVSEKTLNDAAAEGWELDQINENLYYIFRRPVPPKPLHSSGPSGGSS